MKRTVMVIDDDATYVDFFNEKLTSFTIDFNVISNKSFGDIEEIGYSIFRDEVIDIIDKNYNDLQIIFLDLALSRVKNKIGFILGKYLRDKYYDIPIAILTRFSDKQTVEEGYLYDFDWYLNKTKFNTMPEDMFNSRLLQVIGKRDSLIKNISKYYHQHISKHGLTDNYLLAYNIMFTSNATHLENTLDSMTSMIEYFSKSTEISVVMFIDLCDSTSIKQEAGFFEGLNYTRLHNKLATDVIHKFGGTVVKYIGDCTMARFDYRNSKEVNCKPINAAIEIHEIFEKYNSQYRKTASFKVHSKIGISAGVVANFYGNDPQGESVDLAARLTGIAKSQEIVISTDYFNMINVSEIESRVGNAKNYQANDYVQEVEELEIKGFKNKMKVVCIKWD